MAISDELNDEERAIMFSLKRYFESAGMPNALWILTESDNLSDVRAIFQAYREFYKATEHTDKGENTIARYLAILSPLQRLCRDRHS